MQRSSQTEPNPDNFSNRITKAIIHAIILKYLCRKSATASQGIEPKVYQSGNSLNAIKTQGVSNN